MEDKRIILQQGNNNFTKVVGDRVLKTPNGNGASFLELTYPQQVEKWNAYYAGTPYATAFITVDGELSTPYIDGSGHPNDEQRLDICEGMLKKGFLMVDCRDKRNFIVGKNGEVYPIDFGQIYKEGDRNYNLHKSVVNREINSIKDKIKRAASPSESIFKPQKERENIQFQAIEIYLTALAEHKSKLMKDEKNPVAKAKLQTIDTFITDTRNRIEKYKQGDKKAFDGYIEANKQPLEILAQNRISRPILYSALLSLMVIPAIYGVIQMAITKGNSYLFVSDVKTSEKLALNVQNNVIKGI